VVNLYINKTQGIRPKIYNRKEEIYSGVSVRKTPSFLSAVGVKNRMDFRPILVAGISKGVVTATFALHFGRQCRPLRGL
jgi:hypothetical protein